MQERKRATAQTWPALFLISFSDLLEPFAVLVSSSTVSSGDSHYFRFPFFVFICISALARECPFHFFLTSVILSGILELPYPMDACSSAVERVSLQKWYRNNLQHPYLPSIAAQKGFTYNLLCALSEYQPFCTWHPHASRCIVNTKRATKIVFCRTKMDAALYVSSLSRKKEIWA